MKDFIQEYKNNPVGLAGLLVAIGLLIVAHIVGSHWLFDTIMGVSILANLIGTWKDSRKPKV